MPFAMESQAGVGRLTEDDGVGWEDGEVGMQLLWPRQHTLGASIFWFRT